MSSVNLLANAPLIEIDSNDVEIGKRVGWLHHDKAVAFGKSMVRFGQRDPIKVRKNPKGPKPWLLVVGRTRLVGAQLEGLDIWAFDVSNVQADAVQLEVSENLERRDLCPLENACFVGEMVAAARRRLAQQEGDDIKQQAMAIRARWDNAKGRPAVVDEVLSDEVSDTRSNLERVYGWEESVRDAMGFSRSAIYRSLKLFNLIAQPFPDLIQSLSRHPIVGTNEKQLLDIASISRDDLRRKVIEALLANDELGVADAKALVIPGEKNAAKAPRADLEKHKNQIRGGWQRLSVGQKREFIPEFVDLLTDSLKLEAHALLTEQIEELRRTGKLEESSDA